MADDPATPADLAAWKLAAKAGTAPADAVLRKQYAADQIKAEGDRIYTWTISTASVDRDGDTIQVAGWETDAFLRAGGPVLWAHDYRGLPIGKSPWVKAVGASLKARVEFAPAEVYPFAETVRQLVDFGAIKSTSVGFRPDPKKAIWNEQRGGFDFKGQELLEFSVVPVPSNPEALLDTAKGVAAAKAAGMNVEPFRADLLRAMEETEGAGLWVPKGAVLDAFKALSEPRIVVPATFDPGPYVALASEACTKRGRVLSAANESAIRQAHDGITAAQATLHGVLAQMPQMPMEPEDEPMPEHSPKSVSVIASPAVPKYTVNPENVRAAVVAAVNETVRAGIARARGRLD